MNAGKQIALDIKAALDGVIALPFVSEKGAVVFGHSEGGWGSIVLASQNPKSVSGYINFSGGHGSNKGKLNGICGSKNVAAAAGMFGKTTRQSALWLYVKNDSFVGPKFARRIEKAYRKVGGSLTFKMFEPFGAEGHDLASEDGVHIWGPVVRSWLSGLKSQS